VIHSYFEKLFLGYFDVYRAHMRQQSLILVGSSTVQDPLQTRVKKLKKLMLVVTASFAGEK